MGWIIALAVLIAIGLIPVGASFRYENEKLLIYIKALGLSFLLPLGKKKKPEKQEKKAPKKKKQEDELPAPPPDKKKKKKRLDWKAYLPFIRLAIDFLGSLRRKLRLEKLYAKVILAGEDPCDLATAYGYAWAGASNLMAHINRLFVVGDQDVNIECDFMAEKTLATVRVDLTITIGRALGLAVGYGVRALKEFMTFKKRKGGAAK